MKHLVLLALIATLASCTNCQQEADELYKQYLNGIQNANGNPAAIEHIQQQYKREKSKLGC